MIEQLTIENFKSLKRVDLRLGRLNFFIGTNASGKSNVFDALKVLRGLPGDFPLKELFEGGARLVGGGTWPGIRGGLANAIYHAPGVPQPPGSAKARMQIQFVTGLGKAGYEFAFDSLGAAARESLTEDGKEIFFFRGMQAHFRVAENTLVDCYPNPFLGSQLALAFRSGLAGPHKEFVDAWLNHLRKVRFLELEPDILSHYGAASDIARMGEHGENFASLVRHICADARKKKAYLSWLRELRPKEVDDVKTLAGAVGEPLFALVEGGREFPAPVLSAGTLRFAALAAKFFEPEPPEVVAIEEIENGIHGSRLRLLVELLRNQTASNKTQVLATTHSPFVLAWLKPEEYETVFFCKRDETTGESRICPLTEIPHFNEIVRKQSISDLFVEGWLEAAL